MHQLLDNLRFSYRTGISRKKEICGLLALVTQFVSVVPPPKKPKDLEVTKIESFG